MSSKQKVAILGGGMGGLAAAFELSAPERRDRYEVTVHQVGWRLGGKGASARNPAEHFRIEEHGLHLWMGCYENAFRIMRACYGELARPAGAPLATWRDAFKPHDRVVLMEQNGEGWVPWPQVFPVLDSEPGESGQIGDPLELVAGLLRWLLHTSTSAEGEQRFAPPKGACAAGRHKAGGLSALLERALHLFARLPLVRDRRASELAQRAIAEVLAAFRVAAGLLPELVFRDANVSRVLITLDFVAANLIGILHDGLLLPAPGQPGPIDYGQWLRNVERIEHLDYRAWLKRHGAAQRTVDSCIIRGLGDAVFNTGHDGGAGTAVNGLLRLNLTYRGSLFYKMQAGMGETVFTPLYQTLKARGVKFRFFERVDGIELDPSGRRVVAVQMARQAKPRRGEYRPLIDVPAPGGTLACWPPGPDFAQLDDGEVLAGLGADFEASTPIPREEPYRLTDFDALVLGISIGGLPRITPELIARSERWRAMLEHIVTTRTLALQLWLDKSAAELGWPHGPAVVTSYADPLDTWADMSHLLAHEGYGDRVQSLAYFCGSIDDAGADADQAARAERISDEWLASQVGRLMPDLARGGAVDARRVVDQYRRANVRASDRYVLSVPDSARFRLKANESGVENLFLAGDWVRTGMNVGSIEAATMAGLQAARAISGDPIKIPGDIDG